MIENPSSKQRIPTAVNPNLDTRNQSRSTVNKTTYLETRNSQGAGVNNTYKAAMNQGQGMTQIIIQMRRRQGNRFQQRRKAIMQANQGGSGIGF